MISNEKEIFNKLVDERLDEITRLDGKVNPDNLIYRYKGKTTDRKFDKFDNAFNLFDKIRNGKIKLADEKNDQIKFKSNFKWNKKKLIKKNKWKEQRKNVLYNIEMPYKAKNSVIKFSDYYYLLAFEVNYQATKGEAENQPAKDEAKSQVTKYQATSEGKGLKILNPKQILQRLPIALAQIKAGNDSKSLLNQIRQIVYSVYQSKEFKKKFIIT